MSGFGSTSKKAPNEIADGDLKTIEELRGAYQDMREAKLSLNQKATVEGCLTEIAAVKQSLEMTHEQLRRVIGMYGTLAAEFDLFKQQRVKELNVRINNGPTNPADMNGANS